jgi:hypothetical protein
MNTDALEYLRGVQSGANRLLATLEDVGRRDVFSEMEAASANNRYLTVDRNSETANDFEDSEVRIDQIARGQENEGYGLRSRAENPAAVGENRFSITQNGRTTEYAVNVEEGDTNADVNRRIADAVNSANIGVRATVTEEDGNSVLTLESRDTGEQNAFSAYDTEGALLNNAGVTAATQNAQDASYRINGNHTQTSADNSINLGNGVEATLRGATQGEAVTVSAQQNSRGQAGAMRELVNGVNNLVSLAERGGAGNRLGNDLNALLGSYAYALEEVGISGARDGRLSIDQDRLNTAIQDGSLNRLMESNFATGLARIAENAAGSSRANASSQSTQRTVIGSDGNEYNYSNNYTWDSDRGMYTENERNSGYSNSRGGGRYADTSGVNGAGRANGNWYSRWQNAVSTGDNTSDFNTAWRNAQDSINSWSRQWQNAMNSYNQNSNNYAYLNNSSGAIMNLYA